MSKTDKWLRIIYGWLMAIIIGVIGLGCIMFLLEALKLRNTFLLVASLFLFNCVILLTYIYHPKRS